MNNNSLTLTFQSDTDGTGELFASVHYGYYSGKSSAWFDQLALIEFSRKLASTYPLSSESPIHLEGGYWEHRYSPHDMPKIQELHLGLKFYPIDSVGHIACLVSLAVPTSKPVDKQTRLTIEIPTNYQLLREFGSSLERTVSGIVDEAVLEAEIY